MCDGEIIIHETKERGVESPRTAFLYGFHSGLLEITLNIIDKQICK